MNRDFFLENDKIINIIYVHGLNCFILFFVSTQNFAEANGKKKSTEKRDTGSEKKSPNSATPGLCTRNQIEFPNSFS